QLGQAGLTGDVLLAVESTAVFQSAVEHSVSVCVELRAKWGIEVAVANLILEGLELRLDVADEAEVRRLPFGVVGLTGHGDVALDSLLSYRRVQLSGRDQPPFQVTGRSDGHRQELPVPGLDLLPGLELDLFGQPFMGEFRGNVVRDCHCLRPS